MYETERLGVQRSGVLCELALGSGEVRLGFRNSWSRKRVWEAQARPLLAVIRTQSLNQGTWGSRKAAASSVAVQMAIRVTRGWYVPADPSARRNGGRDKGKGGQRGGFPSIPIPWALQRAPVADVHVKQGLEMWKVSFRFVAWAAMPELPISFRRLGKDSKRY